MRSIVLAVALLAIGCGARSRPAPATGPGAWALGSPDGRARPMPRRRRARPARPAAPAPERAAPAELAWRTIPGTRVAVRGLADWAPVAGATAIEHGETGARLVAGETATPYDDDLVAGILEGLGAHWEHGPRETIRLDGRPATRIRSHDPRADGDALLLVTGEGERAVMLMAGWPRGTDRALVLAIVAAAEGMRWQPSAAIDPLPALYVLEPLPPPWARVPEASLGEGWRVPGEDVSLLVGPIPTDEGERLVEAACARERELPPFLAALDPIESATALRVDGSPACELVAGEGGDTRYELLVAGDRALLRVSAAMPRDRARAWIPRVRDLARRIRHAR